METISARANLAGPNDESEERALELLEQTSLRTFQATPAALLPFQSSTLRWQVDAPAGVRLKLNGLTVAKSGSKLVEPVATQTFRLYAHAGRLSKFLGAVTVSVNLSQCTSAESTIVDELLALALTRGVEEDGEVYFRILQVKDSSGRTQFVQAQPQVTMSPGRIRFRLKLAGRVNNFPDPDIDVDASFGLTVARSSDSVAALFPKTELVPTAVEVNVSVSFPWWAYLIPGAVIGLPIAAGMAEDRARAAFTRAIGRFVAEVVNPLFGNLEPANMEKHRARIYVDDVGGGTVEVDFCPVPQPVVVVE